VTVHPEADAQVRSNSCKPLARWCVLHSVKLLHPVALAILFAAPGLYAQSTWEIGGDIGYGWYRNGTIFGAGQTVEAGIRNRFATGAVVCENLYDHFSGEIRYEYHDGHPFLSANGTAKDIQGQSHTFTYEVLIHLRGRDSRLRPYFAAGAGAKDFVIAGPAPDPQPFPTVATLNRNDEWKFVASLGPGVKYRINRHLIVRGDFRDYISPFPKGQIAPAANNTARGLLQQFTPMFGISATW